MKYKIGFFYTDSYHVLRYCVRFRRIWLSLNVMLHFKMTQDSLLFENPLGQILGQLLISRDIESKRNEVKPLRQLAIY